MALPAKTLDEVLAMDSDARRDYFMRFTQYTAPPSLKYTIRVGGAVFYANEKLELWLKMQKHVKNERQKRGKQEKRDGNQKAK